MLVVIGFSLGILLSLGTLRNRSWLFYLMLPVNYFSFVTSWKIWRFISRMHPSIALVPPFFMLARIKHIEINTHFMINLLTFRPNCHLASSMIFIINSAIDSLPYPIGAGLFWHNYYCTLLVKWFFSIVTFIDLFDVLLVSRMIFSLPNSPDQLESFLFFLLNGVFK